MRDFNERSRVEDEQTRMDLYVPTYGTLKEAYENPYSSAYNTRQPVQPARDPMQGKPMPTTASDPFTQSPQRPVMQAPRPQAPIAKQQPVVTQQSK